MILFRYILFVLVLGFTSHLPCAAQPLKFDTVNPKQLSIDPSIEKEIFSDDAYEYKDVKVQTDKGESFWEWLMKKLFGNADPDNISTFFNVIKIILIILFIFGVVWIVLKMNGGKLFKGESAKTSVFTDISEEISTIDIDKLINDSITKNDFKAAFRYTYLKSLQLMNDKKLIDWKPYKTNYEYYDEFKSEKNKPLFKTLYLGFEYVWYGDGTINKQVFEQYKTEFNQFNQQLGA